DVETVATDVVIDDSEYYVLCATYLGAKSNPTGILEAGKTSYPSLLQVYMRPEATNEDAAAIDGNENGTYDILVFSQAVQAKGFADAETALNEAFGTDHPWGDKAPFASAADAAEMDEALKDGATTLVLGSGEFIIPDSAKGKNLTVIGGEDTNVAVQVESGEGCDYAFDGSTVVFENITFNTNSTTYTGFARMKAIYNNCTFNGTYTTYDDSVFNNCTFNVTGNVYNLWTWGAPNVTINNSTFNSDGKAVLLYGPANTNLTVNNCTFNDKGGLTDLKAAIEIGNDYDKSYTLTVNNTTVNGYEINDTGISTGTTLWANKNSMPQTNLNVVVDGVDVY
ncbi:MAG: hypothetical protein IJN82_00595, partial [Clostridia bacterium]|nr:hypothetical protein [Clostridia bacterium]